ncbi:hypothetical protein [Maribacter aquivivus]|uniref:hypothetical protein n=1 Tax=Maribacter aquivivus TaxID=228958 RepID=UPI0024903E5A|nr:hypothetical protein [Maribacter aquivivus]
MIPKEKKIPKWIMERRGRRQPFIFLLLGVIPLSIGIIFGILYLRAPKTNNIIVDDGKIHLQKSSFRDNNSQLYIDFDTLKLKADLYTIEENRYLELVSFSKSFGQEELELPKSSNNSVKEYQNKLIRFNKLKTLEQKIEIEKIEITYSSNYIISSLIINNTTIIKEKNDFLFILMWVLFPLLIGSYVLYLSLKFYK